MTHPPARRPHVAMVLPASEGFAPDRAGAIALIVRRLALASGATVIGRPQQDHFAGVAYCMAQGRAPLIYGFNVLRHLRALQPTCIDVHQQPRLAAAIARLLPTARVTLFLHNDPLTMRGLRRPAQRARMLARLHRVVCVSNYLRTRYAAALPAHHQRSRRLVTLPNPLSLAELPNPPTERTPVILFAGRIVANKGVADFIAACATALPNLPGWSAQIIGGDRFGPNSTETPYVTAMRNAAAAAAAGIGFIGYQPHHAVLAAMADAAIVVVPSRWPEPFGLVALEAMACGAALIATATGGLPEVVGTAGVLIPPADIPALSAAITRLATNPTARQTLSAIARARAQQFDTPIIAARLATLRADETPL